jgi:mannosyltransferase
MSATATETEPGRTPSILRVPPIRDYGAPGWFERLPRGVGTGGVLFLLVAATTYIRAHFLGGQLWFDEANTVGIAVHPLTRIPGLLREGGGAPLYFWILHLWIAAFGDSSAAVHSLSLAIGILTVPAGMWLGSSLSGRRLGYILATLLCFNGFLDRYAEEARPYELMGLLGLIAAVCFLHAFVYRRRRGWLPAFVASLVLLLYTDAWDLLVLLGFGLAAAAVWLRAEERDGIARDAGLAFGVAVLLYLPWLPTLIHQAGASTDPWRYAPLLALNFPASLTGSDRVDVTLAMAVLAAFVPLLTGTRRRSREATVVIALVVLIGGTVLASLLCTLAVPAYAARYMAPLVGPLLLFAAIACARSGLVGLLVLVVACGLLLRAASYMPTHKSDMADVAAEAQPYLSPGDLVVVAQPEQAPLAAYYLPRGLRYATTLGPDRHPAYMDWDGALARLRGARPASTLEHLVAEIAPGRLLLYIRPITGGEENWRAAWPALVRRRAAQWGRLLAGDRELRRVPGFWAPHNYHGSCCIGSSAVLYRRR